MTFYFYDLETSSGSPRSGRIMQFAGQRTNEHLEPIGEPHNILIKLADDVLPEPEAILVHGITPQKTLSEGITEAEFVSWFHETVAINDTIFVGFNNIRFDDEFIRGICYRNFYDPYEWHWKDGRGRWDLLDPMRMMRALRPEGVQWPYLEGKPTVKLELLAKENGVAHENAHDALSDVQALIDIARLFQKNQPKLFDYLLRMRDKRAVAELVEKQEPFIYTSGKYESEFLKTTVVQPLFKHPRRDATIVYDLRYDPEEWLSMGAEAIAERMSARYDKDIIRPPIKTLQHNRCPAIAPLTVLDGKSRESIGYSEDFEKNKQKLLAHPEFLNTLKDVFDILENEQQTRLAVIETTVDERLYDGFWSDKDHAEMLHIRMQDPAEFGSLIARIRNKRLREMMPLYKARNYRSMLTTEEHEAWEAYRTKQLFGGGANSKVASFSSRLQYILANRQLTEQQHYLLSELQLYVESILPDQDE